MQTAAETFETLMYHALERGQPAGLAEISQIPGLRDLPLGEADLVLALVVIWTSYQLPSEVEALSRAKTIRGLGQALAFGRGFSEGVPEDWGASLRRAWLVWQEIAKCFPGESARARAIREAHTREAAFFSDRA